MAIEKERFIKIPADQWKYELESGEISWDEHSVREWLWLKANPVTGKVPVNYKILATELKGRFPYVKDLTNKLSKIMISLKKKQRLWFEKHRGNRGSITVELHGFPLMNRQYTDISYHFQQNSSRGSAEFTSQDNNQQAELPEPKQKLEGSKTPENERDAKDLDSGSSRGPKRESIDEEEERKVNLPSPPGSSFSPSPENDKAPEKNNAESVAKKEERRIEFFSPNEVWEYFNDLLVENKGAGLPELSEKAHALIDDFLDKYGSEKVSELIDYYLYDEGCEKDRQKMGITLSVIFGEVVIGRWLNSLEGNYD